MRQFIDAWRGFVPAAIEDSSAILHISRLIEHLSPAMLAREREEHPELRAFAANNLRDLLDLLEGMDPSKLEELRIETKDLAAIDEYPNVARKLYEFGHYRLNAANFDAPLIQPGKFREPSDKLMQILAVAAQRA